LLMAMIWLVPHFLGRWGVNPAVGIQTDAYLRILNWGTLPLLAYAAFRRYLQGIGQVRPVTFALISANLVNWAGNWALIYGKLGLPAMGVRGSALSTCVARVYMAAVLIFAAWRYEGKRGHRLFHHWGGPNQHRLLQLLRLGVPTACQIVLEVGAFGLATVLAGRLRAEALAAHQIALNCASLTYMVPLGISAAAAVSVGHAVGAGQLARARRVGWMAIGISSAFMAAAAVVFLVVPVQILHVYTHAAGVVALGVPLLALAAAFQVFDGMQTAVTGALRGLGETRAPMVWNLVGYWVFGLPLGAFLCFHAGLGIYGMWIGLTLALIFIAVLLLRRWARQSSQFARSVISSEIVAGQRNLDPR
jgi:multidrug resistance protein, MATE family